MRTRDSQVLELESGAMLNQEYFMAQSWELVSNKVYTVKMKFGGKITVTQKVFYLKINTAEDSLANLFFSLSAFPFLSASLFSLISFPVSSCPSFCQSGLIQKLLKDYLNGCPHFIPIMYQEKKCWLSLKESQSSDLFQTIVSNPRDLYGFRGKILNKE